MKIESVHVYLCPHCGERKVVKLTCEEKEMVTEYKICSKTNEEFWLMLQYSTAWTKGHQLVGIPFSFLVCLDDPHIQNKDELYVATEVQKGNIGLKE